MVEFKSNYVKEQLLTLKNSLNFIAGNNLPPEKIDKAMEKQGLPDLVNYRSRGSLGIAGKELADDFKKALNELDLAPDRKNRIAQYLLYRIGGSKEDGWNETRDYIRTLLIDG
jgi:hypothetical protein